MFLIELDGLRPLVQALGWALVHFIWQGAVIGALFAAGKLALRNGRPESRYFLGLGCMLLLLAAPIISFIALYQGGQQGATTASAVAVNLAAQAAQSGFDFGDWIERTLPWVVLGWVSGVVVMSARVSLSWYRLYRCLRIGVKELDEELRAKVEWLRHFFEIDRKVQVLESTLVQVPTVFGWLKPVILLPTSSLIGLTPAQLELVIAHELGHIRRFDYLTNLFQVTVETLLFYHPVVRWISRHIRQEREQCCDDLVVKTCGNRLEYAKALTNLETMRSGGSLAPALAATDGELLQRIERIVCTHGQPRDAVLGNSGVLLLVAAAIIMAGRVADPMAAFEAKRNLLADTLASELFIADNGQQPFALLEEARLAPPNPSPAKASAPTVAQRLERESRSSLGATVPTEGLPDRAPAVQPAPAVAAARGAPFAEAQLTPLTDADDALGRDPQRKSQRTVSRPMELAALPKTPDFSAPAAPGPVVIARVSPEYPVRARIAGQQGFVELSFSLRTDGRVTDVRIGDSWPRRVFDRAATKAIKAWRFDPQSFDDASGIRLTQRFDFNISSGELLSRDKRGCLPVTGTRICRPESPTSLLSQEAHVDGAAR